MNHNEHIADYIIPATGTVPPTEPLHRIRHLMETDELPSIIVADENRPVGVIRWNDIRDANDIPAACLARDIMLSGCPTLEVDSPASEACASFDLADLDRLPVVNACGELVGVVSRAALLQTMDGHSDMHTSLSPPAGSQIRRVFTVRPGMKVFSMDGMQLGLVNRMFLDGGTVSGFMVAYGPLVRRHKYLNFHVVDHLEDETILLSVDADQFYRLPDMHA
jgi:CBS domain-containing protein